MDFIDAASSTSTFKYSELTSGIAEAAIATRLRDHGFAVLHLDNLVEDEQTYAMMSWERVFQEAFSAEAGLANSASCAPSPYRSERGVTLGFRKDETRAFFESRRSFENRIDPSSTAPSFDRVALALFRLLGAVGRTVTTSMAKLLGLKPNYFTHLMDEEDIPESEHFSSAVLRICNYKPGEHITATSPTRPDIAFGSHTDTSFVTVAPVSSNNGLELMDLMDGSWHMVEVGAPSPSVVVFTGECIQMLTKSYYRAAVHRVRVTSINNRISCPLIIRGRKKSLISKIDEDELSRIGDERMNYVADLDGTSMGLIHKMLDFKRLKCRDLNSENGDDWVLAAYTPTIGSFNRIVYKVDELSS